MGDFVSGRLLPTIVFDHSTPFIILLWTPSSVKIVDMYRGVIWSAAASARGRVRDAAARSRSIPARNIPILSGAEPTLVHAAEQVDDLPVLLIGLRVDCSRDIQLCLRIGVADADEP